MEVRNFMEVRDFICTGIVVAKGYEYTVEAKYHSEAESKAAQNFQEDMGTPLPLGFLTQFFRCRFAEPKTPGRKPTYLGEEIERLIRTKEATK